MTEKKHRVVIVGGGFAGISAARALKKAPVEVTLIDRRNHHLFQPLLYQVATGGLSPADISAPIRGLLAGQKNARVLLAEVEGIDVPRKELATSGGPVPYDTLVLATGASHSYFGNEAWAEHAPGLKTLEDATAIRKKILLAFEAAEIAETEEERRAWLTFVVIGGGPTGVELAGAIGELSRQTLRRDFRSFKPASARVLLLEGGDRVLPTYSQSLSPKAGKSLGKLGVEVWTGTLATDISSDGVTVRRSEISEQVASKTVLWAAGVAASPLGRMLAESAGCETDREGRVVISPDLTVPGHPEVFVIGDLASYSHQTGAPLRGTADVAGAEGKYVGKLISARVWGKGAGAARPFRFRDLGKLAVIGRSAAVADLRFIRFDGYLAWQFWLFAHLLKLVGFQNRLTVLVQWAWSYMTRKKSARLITGEVDWEELRRRQRREADERENGAA
jgi:NADH dehydrogenase